MISPYLLALLSIPSGGLVSAQAPYTSLGCFALDAGSPGLRTNEGKFASLDGTGATRVDPINKCYQIASGLGHNVFGLLNGACSSQLDFVPNGYYAKNGNSTTCANGIGSATAWDVYQVTGAASLVAPNYTALPYVSLGCWGGPNSRRILPSLEGLDPILDSTYHARSNPIWKCYQIASYLGYNVFGIMDGGACAAALDNVPNGDYTRYENYTSIYCPPDGEGGSTGVRAAVFFHVYQIKDLPQASTVLNYTLLPYTPLGCFNDVQSGSGRYITRSLRLNEGLFPSLKDRAAVSRIDAVNKCYQVALSRGHNVFAISNGAYCTSQLDVVPGGSYAQFGQIPNNTSPVYCGVDGRGNRNLNIVGSTVFQIKNATGASFDFNTLPYTSLGCWNDVITNNGKSLRLNEGLYPSLDGDYRFRTDAINKCYQVAQSRGHNVFALQDGGACYSGLDAVNGGSYAQYGGNSSCPTDGLGNPNINHVYQIKNAPGPVFNFNTLPYNSLGCWNDITSSYYNTARALRPAEGSSSVLDGDYRFRQNAIDKCYQVAQTRGHNLFSLQDGGQCFTSSDVANGGYYTRYGNSSLCPTDGRGAFSVNHVYQIKNAPEPSFDFNTLPYISLGCFNDNPNGWYRTLRPVPGVFTNSIDQCYQWALNRGSNVFALQDTGTCYTLLDTVPGGSYARLGNTTNCYADRRGTLAINHVFQIKNATGASFDFNTLPYTSLGCWKDMGETTRKVLRLNEGLFSILDGNSGLRTDAVNKCYQAAQSRGHNIFALQNGGACYSGLDVVDGGYSIHGPADTCPADGKGHVNANAVYQIKNATALQFNWGSLPYTSLGCYFDTSVSVLSNNEGTSSILDGSPALRSDAINKCYQVAQSRGHNIFGLQNGGSCYSSFDVVPGGDYAKNGLSLYCPYDGRGGSLINHIYRINNATTRTITFADLPYRSGLPFYSLGCWVDSSTTRALTLQEGTDAILDGSFSVRANAVFKCYLVAVKRGHNVFGVQNGGQCYSRFDTIPGGAYAQYGRASQCPITGKGGNLINHVYRVVV